MNKDEVLDALEDKREDFLEAIEGLSDEELQEPGVVGEWSVKDIMAHINLWEAELIKLLWQAKAGQKPTTVHFSNISVDDLNAQWYLNSKSRSLERVMADFEAVRKQTVRRVEFLTNKDLNDENRYPWLSGHPLWTWIAQDSYDHEAEHAEQIRQWRQRREQGRSKEEQGSIQE